MYHFINHIESHTTLLNGEAEKILSCIETEEIIKNTIILEQGEYCNYTYFILKGCLRIYTLNDSGKEQILHFAIENWWITDLTSFLNKTKSRFYIQALEDSEIIKISYEKYNYLLEEIPNFNKFIRTIFQLSFANLQEHFIDTLNRSGEARYLAFIEKNPQMTQRISQYMIASYLGLTPEFISKIRKNLVL